MVRVVSPGFSTPRSRHSSGEEMIDRFSAMRAISALHETDHEEEECSELGTKTLVIACDTDTNDSYSGLDSEEDILTGKMTALDNRTTDCKQDSVVEKRKQRRRERNKVSAQNYRQRRREQTSNAEKLLGSLEAQHKMLLEKIRHLESEKHIVEDYLKNCVKIPWCPYHHPCPPVNNPASPASPKTMPVSMSSEAPVESGSSVS